MKSNRSSPGLDLINQRGAVFRAVIQVVVVPSTTRSTLKYRRHVASFAVVSVVFFSALQTTKQSNPKKGRRLRKQTATTATTTTKGKKKRRGEKRSAHVTQPTPPLLSFFLSLLLLLLLPFLFRLILLLRSVSIGGRHSLGPVATTTLQPNQRLTGTQPDPPWLAVPPGGDGCQPSCRTFPFLLSCFHSSSPPPSDLLFSLSNQQVELD